MSGAVGDCGVARGALAPALWGAVTSVARGVRGALVACGAAVVCGARTAAGLDEGGAVAVCRPKAEVAQRKSRQANPLSARRESRGRSDDSLKLKTLHNINYQTPSLSVSEAGTTLRPRLTMSCAPKLTERIETRRAAPRSSLRKTCRGIAGVRRATAGVEVRDEVCSRDAGDEMLMTGAGRDSKVATRPAPRIAFSTFFPAKPARMVEPERPFVMGCGDAAISKSCRTFSPFVAFELAEMWPVAGAGRAECASEGVTVDALDGALG